MADTNSSMIVDEDFIIPEPEADYSKLFWSPENENNPLQPLAGAAPETLREEEVDAIADAKRALMLAGAGHEMNFGDVLYARVPQARSLRCNRQADYAHGLLERVADIRRRCSSGGGGVADHEFVLVCDIAAPDHAQRFLAQNRKSHEIFGDVSSGGGGGLRRLLSRADEVKRSVACAGAAFLNPGREFKVPLHHHCFDGVEREFHCTFVVDPASYLLIRIGHHLAAAA